MSLNGAQPWFSTCVLSLMLMSITMVLAMRLPIVENWLSVWIKRIESINGLVSVVWHWVSHTGCGTKFLSHWWLLSWLLRSTWWFRATSGLDWLGNVGQRTARYCSKYRWMGFYLLLVLFVASLWAAVKYKTVQIVAPSDVGRICLSLFTRQYCLNERIGESLLLPNGGICFGWFIAAIYSLLGLVGRRNRHQQLLSLRLKYFPQAEVMELVLKPDASWQGHRPGSLLTCASVMKTRIRLPLFLAVKIQWVTFFDQRKAFY